MVNVVVEKINDFEKIIPNSVRNSDILDTESDFFK